MPLLYRYPPFVLAPERLYPFMHHLIQTKDVPGAVVEIGCNLGGTAVIAKLWRKLEGTHRRRRVLPRERLPRAIHVRNGYSLSLK